MKNWINSRKKQSILILVALHILLIFGIIFPTYEKIPYYNQQITRLKEHHKTLLRYAFHNDHHKENFPEIQKELVRLKQQLEEHHDPAFIQRKIGTLTRQHQIEIIQQDVSPQKLPHQLQGIILKQTLEGQYESLQLYLESLLSSCQLLVLAESSYTNQQPLKRNPRIRAEFQFIHFQSYPP